MSSSDVSSGSDIWQDEDINYVSGFDLKIHVSMIFMGSSTGRGPDLLPRAQLTWTVNKHNTVGAAIWAHENAIRAAFGIRPPTEFITKTFNHGHALDDKQTWLSQDVMVEANIEVRVGFCEEDFDTESFKLRMNIYLVNLEDGAPVITTSYSEVWHVWAKNIVQEDVAWHDAEIRAAFDIEDYVPKCYDSARIQLKPDRSWRSGSVEDEEEIILFILHKADTVTAKLSIFLWEMDEILTTEVSDDEWLTITGKVMTDQRLARACSLKWITDKIGRVLPRRYGEGYDMERYRRCAERELFPLAQQQDSPPEWLPPVNFIESTGTIGSLRDGRRLTISFGAGRAVFDTAMDLMSFPRFSDSEWDFAWNQDDDDDEEGNWWFSKEPEAWTAMVLVKHLAMLRGHGDDYNAILRSRGDMFDAFLTGHIVRLLLP